MIDPSGPLPKGVYLRRRLLAVAGSAFGVVVLIWIIDGLLGEGDVPGIAAPSAAGVVSSPPAAPTSSRSAPSSSASPTASTTVPPPPPDPGLLCPDAAVSVTAEVGVPTYRVAQKPLLRLVVVNTGPVPCTRDIGRAQRELVVSSPDGATRTWSSNDCNAAKGELRQVLAPGERQSFDVRWAGRTSAAGCPAKRAAVPAGDYVVTPRLGPLVGKGVPLALTP